MSKTIGSLLVKLGWDPKAADQGLKKFERDLNNFQRNVEKIGKTMSVGFTAPFLLAMRQGIKEFDESAKAEKRLELAIGGVNKNLLEQAKAISRVTLYESDAIVSNQALLAAIGLTEAQIIATTAAAIDLSAVLNIGLDEAFKMLSKTWVGSHGQLGKLIPGFKNLTKEQLKNGEAITMIGTMYEGFAEKLAKEGAGPITMMNKALKDASEVMARSAMPAITDMTGKIQEMAEDFTDLDPKIQATIVKFGMLGAAAGPVLVLATNISELVRNVGLMNAGKVGLVLGLWAGLKEFTSAAGGMKTEEDRAAKLSAFREMSASAYRSGDKGEIAKVKAASIPIAAGEMFAGRFESAAAFTNAAQGKDLAGAMRTGRGSMAGFAETVDGIKGVTNAFEDLNEEIKTTPQKLVPWTEWAFDQSFSTSDDDNSPIMGQFSKITAPTAQGMGSNQALAALSTFGTIDSGAILGQMGDIAPDLDFETQTEQLEQYKNTWLSLGEAMTGVISDMGSSLQSGEQFFASFAKAVLKSVAAVIRALLMESLAHAVKDSASKAGLPGLIIGTAVGVGAISVLEGLLSNIKAPALAQGGMAYGPTMALVGDNPNAHIDPEVISPLSKLKGMIGGGRGGSVTHEFKIRGGDLYASAMYAHQNNDRMQNPTITKF